MDKTSIIKVKDVMKNGIITIDGMAKASEAAALMRQEGDYYVMVNKRHPNDEWGIVVVKDLIKGVMLAGRSADDVHVYEIMTKPVFCLPCR